MIDLTDSKIPYSSIAEITILSNNFKFKGPILKETPEIVEILDLKTGSEMSFPKTAIILKRQNKEEGKDEN